MSREDTLRRSEKSLDFSVGELPTEASARSRWFRQLLTSGGVCLFDGPVATMLYERGVYINRSFDEVNLTSFDLVKEIHNEYLAAGAQVLRTNTWGANQAKLKAFGLAERMRDINLAGVAAARAVAGKQALVAGCMGPLGVRIEPWGPTPTTYARAVFREQAKTLVEGGVDLFVLESFADLNEIHEAIQAVKEFGDFPIVALMSTNEEGQTLFGVEPEWSVQKLEEFGADVVGLNGGNGPSPMLEVMQRIRSATNKPVMLSPNAGLPRLVDGRLIYMASPEYLGEFGRQALLYGARIIGGCSGIRPEHIRTMRGALRQSVAFGAHAAEPAEGVVEVEVSTSEVTEAALTTEPKSEWSRKISEGKFVVSLELVPPKGLDTSKLVERALVCKQHGIDAINIPDGPRASARMSAMATACILERETGMETILHYACRDRNLLGIQSDILGAAGLGLKNVLCITGDPPKLGPYPNATAVFDTDSIGLLNMIARLNRGQDLGGSSIGKATALSPGAGVNPVAPDLKKEKFRFRHKVAGGAEWTITQPVFEADSLFRFLEYAAKFNIAVIAGVWPLTSLRSAEFMANEVPGVFVPQEVLERMARAETAADQRKVGLEIAHELIEKIKPSVRGLQLSAPLGQVELALGLL